jgi:glutaredoxin 3
MKLTLYFLPGCPFCQKVLDFIAENHLSIEKKNISESDEIRDQLIALGGKSQVPCLIIDDQALYESQDIIEWLKKNLVKT